MRAIFLLSLALMLGGCSHSKPVSVAGSPCRIVERVYHEGWRTCGEITVSATAHYSWTVSDIWSTPPKSQTFSGELPATIFQQLAASSGSFEMRDGVRTYEVGIDDTKTQLPAGVDSLRTYLHTTHLTKR